jgi:hypothetical protein
MRAEQLVTFALAGVLALLILVAKRDLGGAVWVVIVGVVAVAVAFLPLGRRSAATWAPVVLSYLRRRSTGRHRFRSQAHVLGHFIYMTPRRSVADVVPPEQRPQSLRGLQILEAQLSSRRDSMAVIKDGKRRTYTAVLSARGASFLVDETAQPGQIAVWNSILAGYGLSGTVSRLQWQQRSLPDDGRGVTRYHREVDERLRAAGQPPPEAAARIYGQAIAEGRPVTRQHQLLLAVQVDARRPAAARLMKEKGQGVIDRGAAALLMEELDSLSHALGAAGIEVEGILTPGLLSRYIRSAYEPEFLGRWEVLEEAWRQRGEEAPDGPHVHNAWPHFAEEGFSYYRTGPRAMHSTFWIREWPRGEVRPDFLSPLLVYTECVRTVSMTLVPIDPDKAERIAQAAKTGQAAEAKRREKGGWITTWRQQREQEHTEQIGQELADGYVGYRIAGYVTVSARTPGELETSCTDVQKLAAQSGQLQLERLAGEQEVAFTYALPLCRGVR